MSLVPKENLPVAALGSNSKIFHGFHAWTLFRVLDWLTDWLPEFAFHQHLISKSQSWQCWCMSETSEFLKVKLENIGHLQSCNVLDTPDIMFVLVSRLWDSSGDKWSRNVLTKRQMHTREPDLINFIHFVNKETLIVSDPIFSKEAVDQCVDKNQNSRTTKVSSYATKDDSKLHVDENLADCVYCSKDNKLDRCNAFMKETLKKRIKFFSRKKICCGALQPVKI